MAPGSNWLSFTLSPMEMLRSSSSSSDHNPSQFMSYDDSSTPHFFLDNFYSYNNNGCWSNINAKEARGEKATTTGEYFFINQTEETLTQAAAPKLEDFLGDNSCQTESNPTQEDSSLTHFYDDHHHQSVIVASYFNNDPQELKAIAGFQAFSANSGSEGDDSLHASELGFARNSEKGLSLGVNNDGNNNNGNDRLGDHKQQEVSVEKGIVISGEFRDCSKNNIVDTFGQRTSIYRGVTRHRWTGRYEAHLWDNSCRREGQARKGRQVYLGGYDKEEKAARAYDLAALKYWGTAATTNFPVSNYDKELEEMKYLSRQEFIASLRRKSSGFSRGASMYRGVTRHHQQGRWQARIGRVAGNKDLYLGTFATEEEAAEAYDIAAIKFRGLNAVTNFEMSRYDVEAIMKSTLPIGGAGKRLKLSLEVDQKPVVALDQQQPQGCSNNGSDNISFSNVQQPVSTIPCGVPFDATVAFYHHALFQNFHPVHNFPALESLNSPSLSTPMAAVVPQTTEFFVWPHHQS